MGGREAFWKKVVVRLNLEGWMDVSSVKDGINNYRNLSAGGINVHTHSSGKTVVLPWCHFMSQGEFDNV